MGRNINLTGRIFAVVACSVALYAGVAAWTGWQDLRGELAGFRISLLPSLVLLSLGNYLLRYWRWEIYLRRLGIRIPWRDSMALFFGTFVMVITPGKLGEAFKAGILWERHGVSLSRGLPVILAERLFDFLAVLLLAGIGLITWSGPLTGLTAGLLVAAALPVLLIVVRSARVRQVLLEQALRAPWLRRHRLAAEDSLESFAVLLGRWTCLPALGLSVVAWACECVSLWLVAAGLGFSLTLLDAVFVYAAGTIVGSLTFLPGGLGGTEGTLIWLLTQLDIAREAAVSAALVVRIATLWLAVLLGLVVFVTFRDTFLGAGVLAEPSEAPVASAGPPPRRTETDEGGPAGEPPSS